MNQTKTEDWVSVAIQEGKQALLDAAVERRSLIDDMVDDVAAGIEVLRSMNGLPVTRDMAMERARNIIGRFVLNYRITRQERP